MSVCYQYPFGFLQFLCCSSTNLYSGKSLVVLKLRSVLQYSKGFDYCCSIILACLCWANFLVTIRDCISKEMCILVGKLLKNIFQEASLKRIINGNHFCVGDIELTTKAYRNFNLSLFVYVFWICIYIYIFLSKRTVGDFRLLKRFSLSRALVHKLWFLDHYFC